jgi:hypothetical protein
MNNDLYRKETEPSTHEINPSEQDKTGDACIKSRHEHCDVPLEHHALPELEDKERSSFTFFDCNLAALALNE